MLRLKLLGCFLFLIQVYVQNASTLYLEFLEKICPVKGES